MAQTKVTRGSSAAKSRAGKRTKTEPQRIGESDLSEADSEPPKSEKRAAAQGSAHDWRFAEAERKRVLQRESLSRAVIEIVCAGSYASEKSDEGNCSAEHALLRYAAATTRAVAIALCAGPEWDSDIPQGMELPFDESDGAVVLGGLSALLSAAPKLISELRAADVAVASANLPYTDEPIVLMTTEQPGGGES